MECRGRADAGGRETCLRATRCSRSSSRKRPRKPLAPVSRTTSGSRGSCDAGAAAAAAARSSADKKRSSLRSAALTTLGSLPWMLWQVMPAGPSPLQVKRSSRGAQRSQSDAHENVPCVHGTPAPHWLNRRPGGQADSSPWQALLASLARARAARREAAREPRSAQGRGRRAHLTSSCTCAAMAPRLWLWSSTKDTGRLTPPQLAHAARELDGGQRVAAQLRERAPLRARHVRLVQAQGHLAQRGRGLFRRPSPCSS